jgi:predicted Rossmann fold flavoprotein
MLFTHFGLSGPAVLDVSRAITGAQSVNDVMLVVDLLPAVRAADLEVLFQRMAVADGKRLVAGVLAEQLPRRLVDALLARAEVVGDRRMAQFSADERRRVTEQLKRCEIVISGTRGFEKAEVTAGGVDLAEVDSRTMESKLVPNLYLAGEILDLDGFIGGYNFQAAFSTGWVAGESV